MNLEDEGDFVYPALRIIRGQLPYLDFESGLAPGCLYILAAWLKVFGHTLQSARCFALLVIFVSQILVYLLARQVLKTPAAFFACLCFTFTSLSNWPVTSYHHLSQTSVLLTIWLSLQMLKHPERKFFAVAAGAAASLSAFILQTAGVCSILICLATAGVIFFAHGPSVAGRATLKGIGGALLLGLPCLLVLVMVVGWEPVWQNLVYNHLSAEEGRIGLQKKEFLFVPWDFVNQGLSAMSSLSYSEMWAQKIPLLRFLSWPTVYLATVGLFYPSLVLFLIVSAIRFHKDKLNLEHKLVLFLSVSTLVCSVASLYRPSSAHIGFVRHTWWILVVFYLLRLFRDSKSLIRFPVIAISALLFASILVQIHSQRNKFANLAQTVVYLPGGTLRTANSRFAANLQSFAAYLGRRNLEHPKMLVYPIFPMLYFLLDGENVTRHERLVPVWSPERDFDSVLDSFAQNKPDVIVLLDFDYDAYLKEYPALDRESFLKIDRQFRQQMFQQGIPVVILWPEFRVFESTEPSDSSGS